MPDIAAVSRFLAVRAVRSLKLSGGEPTVRTDLAEIVHSVGEAGVKPVVITNGFHVPDEAIAAVRSHGGEFKFSIHRPSVENDQILRRTSFVQIRENIDKVTKGEVGMSINTVVAPGGVGLMRAMVDFACEVGARKISFIPVVGRGRARRGSARGSAFEFLPDELAAVRKSVVEMSLLFAGVMKVNCIDIRNRDYWVIENDGSLWIERATEGADVKICDKWEMLTEL